MGAYNALSLFVPDPMEFEKEMLQQVGLAPASISTQIVQPEFVTDLVSFCVTSFSVLANWAQDMRNLMRPELKEVWLPRGKDTSASSIMPHKKNPIGWENIGSLWKVAIPRIITLYMDQISENARDLTNSASQRFIPEIFDLYDHSIIRGIRIAGTFRTIPENMKRNLLMSANTIAAEPLQLLLSSVGRYTAHEEVGRLADKAAAEGVSVVKLAMEDPLLAPYMLKLKKENLDVLFNVETYGVEQAQKTALKIADKWERKLDELKL